MKYWYDKIKEPQSVETLEEILVSLFGKKGDLATEFAKMKDLCGAEKGNLAKELNAHKSPLRNEFTAKTITLQTEALRIAMKAEAIDLALIHI